MYIETSVQINSVVNFSQFIIRDKLVTIIGEIHDRYFKCKGKSVSVNKYIENRLKYNMNSSVFLEFNKDTDKIKDLGSFNLKQTVNVLKKHDINIPSKHGENTNRIKSTDHRDYFFESYDLYADNEHFMSLDIDSIISEFISPYFEVRNRLKGNGDETQYIKNLISYKTHDISLEDDIFSFLKDEYIPSIEKEFTTLRNYLEEYKEYNKKKQNGYKEHENMDIFSKIPLLERIRYVWAKVSDLYIISELFNTNCSHNEIIILIGNIHYFNLEKVLRHFRIPQINTQENPNEDPENCISAKIFKPI